MFHSDTDSPSRSRSFNRVHNQIREYLPQLCRKSFHHKFAGDIRLEHDALVLQTPIRTGTTLGSFALRSPVRPNPIASSFVDLVAIEGGTLSVRGLDCMDGTPVVDLKPDHAPSA